jgi:hypothetical protein
VRKFDSIDQFVRFLDTRVPAVHKAQHDGLAAAGDVVVADARSKIGTYQERPAHSQNGKTSPRPRCMAAIMPRGGGSPVKSRWAMRRRITRC